LRGRFDCVPTSMALRSARILSYNLKKPRALYSFRYCTKPEGSVNAHSPQSTRPRQ